MIALVHINCTIVPKPRSVSFRNLEKGLYFVWDSSRTYFAKHRCKCNCTQNSNCDTLFPLAPTAAYHKKCKECYVLYCNKVTDDILIPKITRYFLLHRTRPILLKHSIIQPTSVLLPECQNAKAIWGSNFKSLNPQSPNLHNTHKNKYGHILRVFYQK